MRNEKLPVTQSNKRPMVDLHIISQEVFIILEVSNEEEPFLKKCIKIECLIKVHWTFQ